MTMTKENNKAHAPVLTPDNGLKLEVNGTCYLVHSKPVFLMRKPISLEKDTPDDIDNRWTWTYLTISERDGKPFCIVIRVPCLCEGFISVDDIPIKVGSAFKLRNHVSEPYVVFASGRHLPSFTGRRGMSIDVRPATREESSVIFNNNDARVELDMLSISDAAKFCNCSKRSIYNRLRKVNADGTAMIADVIGKGRLTRIPQSSLSPFVKNTPSETNVTSPAQSLKICKQTRSRRKR